MNDLTLQFTTLDPLTITFFINVLICLLLGYLIGGERELRGKDAGISTHTLVMTGAMLFTFLSLLVDPQSTSRIAAQVVTGIGFLGAGLILKDGASVRNLTTAASLWMVAAIGMAVGYGFYQVALISGLVAAMVPRIRRLRQMSQNQDTVWTPIDDD
jgi:putative Mg2+ transporter-C (MgtC) family protein